MNSSTKCLRAWLFYIFVVNVYSFLSWPCHYYKRSADARLRGSPDNSTFVFLIQLLDWDSSIIIGCWDAKNNDQVELVNISLLNLEIININKLRKVLSGKIIINFSSEQLQLDSKIEIFKILSLLLCEVWILIINIRKWIENIGQVIILLFRCNGTISTLWMMTQQ